MDLLVRQLDVHSVVDPGHGINRNQAPGPDEAEDAAGGHHEKSCPTLVPIGNEIVDVPDAVRVVAPESPAALCDEGGERIVLTITDEALAVMRRVTATRRWNRLLDCASRATVTRRSRYRSERCIVRDRATRCRNATAHSSTWDRKLPIEWKAVSWTPSRTATAGCSSS